MLVSPLTTCTGCNQVNEQLRMACLKTHFNSAGMGCLSHGHVCRQHLELEKEASTLRQGLSVAGEVQTELQACQERVLHLQEEVQRLQDITSDQEAAAAAEQELRARVRTACWPDQEPAAISMDLQCNSFAGFASLHEAC